MTNEPDRTRLTAADLTGNKDWQPRFDRTGDSTSTTRQHAKWIADMTGDELAREQLLALRKIKSYTQATAVVIVGFAVLWVLSIVIVLAAVFGGTY